MGYAGWMTLTRRQPIPSGGVGTMAKRTSSLKISINMQSLFRMIISSGLTFTLSKWKLRADIPILSRKGLF